MSRKRVTATVVLALLGLVVLAATGCLASFPVPTTTQEWDPDALTIEKQVGYSAIIAVGTIVKIDESRWNSPDGEEWRPREEETLPIFYTTFYVEPTELLKGTPEWDTPIAFRVTGRTTEGDLHLSEGDKVVVFGASDQRYGTGGVYEPADAYWLTMENNSAWVEEAGVYKNQGRTKDPAEAALSLQALKVRVAGFTSGETSTSTPVQ